MKVNQLNCGNPNCEKCNPPTDKPRIFIAPEFKLMADTDSNREFIRKFYLEEPILLMEVKR